MQKKQLLILLQSSNKRIYLLFSEVQQQGDVVGVFTLAFVHTLAE